MTDTDYGMTQGTYFSEKEGQIEEIWEPFLDTVALMAAETDATTKSENMREAIRVYNVLIHILEENGYSLVTGRDLKAQTRQILLDGIRYRDEHDE